MKAKAFILGGMTAAIITLSSVIAPASASATSISGGVAGTASISNKTKLTIGANGLSFENDFNMCTTFAAGFAASIFGKASTDVKANGCGTAATVINNPPANSTVTINGLCDDDAAKAKAHISGTNVTVIVNSTGACDNDDETTETPVPTTPVQVNVTPNTPQPVAATTASAVKTSTASELPVTGANEVLASIVAAVLAATTYSGVMLARKRRA